MSDQLEEIIKEIAAKHGIVVSRDDPILVLQTMNYRLLQDSARCQQVQLDHYKEELEALSARWSQDARGRAEQILNASLAAEKEAMSQVMQETAQSAAATISAELAQAVSQIHVPLREVSRIAVLNLAASCLTIVAAAVALWAALS